MSNADDNTKTTAIELVRNFQLIFVPFWPR